MIVSEEELKRIIHETNVVDTQMIAIVRQYLLDVKGVEVSIQVPKDQHNVMLLHVAFEAACKYYYNKYDV